MLELRNPSSNSNFCTLKNTPRSFPSFHVASLKTYIFSSLSTTHTSLHSTPLHSTPHSQIKPSYFPQRPTTRILLLISPLLFSALASLLASLRKAENKLDRRVLLPPPLPTLPLTLPPPLFILLLVMLFSSSSSAGRLLSVWL
jgi:hypothetical protein